MRFVGMHGNAVGCLWKRSRVHGLHARTFSVWHERSERSIWTVRIKRRRVARSR